MRAASNIVLIGFMGTGKTTVGKALSDRLGWKLVDTDDWIRAREQRSIPEIFAQDGEAYFREVETAVIRDALGERNCVISTGGGAVLKEENRRLMLEGGLVVALTAPSETIISRLRKDTDRPLLNGDKEENVRRLMEVRKNAYDFAQIVVDTSLWDVNYAAEIIIDAYEQRE